VGARKERSIFEHGGGLEPEVATWDALCRLEQMLRTRRGELATRGRRSHAELLGAE